MVAAPATDTRRYAADYPADGKAQYQTHNWCMQPDETYSLFVYDNNQESHGNGSHGWDGGSLYIVRASDGCVLANAAVPYADRFSGNTIYAYNAPLFVEVNTDLTQTFSVVGVRFALLSRSN